MTEGNRIGIVGGGQLGRMLTEAAKPMGFEVTVLEKEANCPAVQAGANLIQGEITDDDAIEALGNQVDVVTWEIEHISTEGLWRVVESGKPVYPSPGALEIIQDKLHQKTYLRELGLPVADFQVVDDGDDFGQAFATYGPGQTMLKTRRGGYDGRGNMVIYDEGDWQTAQEQFGEAELYAERMVSFEKELAVIAARDVDGNIATYPVVETLHQDNICHMVLSPAIIEHDVRRDAEEIAHETLRHLDGAGVFAIEMFFTDDEDVLINEIAPRVHNSGHHTMEGNDTSQFEQHIRAITGLPLGSTAITRPSAMINILGDRNGEVTLRGREKVLALPGVYLHLYGKSPTKIARKMGHITALADFASEAGILATQARGALTI